MICDMKTCYMYGICIVCMLLYAYLYENILSPAISSAPFPRKLQDNGILHDESLALNTVLSPHTNFCCPSEELIVAS